MTLWRNSASIQAQHDIDGLIDPALTFAKRQLARHGEFFPYAVVVRTDGQTEMIAARPGADNARPTSNDVIDSCRTTLAERRDHLRAAAVVADIHLPDGSDAVRVELEHTEGPAVTILLPYFKRRFNHDFHYGPLQGFSGSRQIWH